jgi:hypothetical protein
MSTIPAQRGYVPRALCGNNYDTYWDSSSACHGTFPTFKTYAEHYMFAYGLNCYGSEFSPTVTNH